MRGKGAVVVGQAPASESVASANASVSAEAEAEVGVDVEAPFGGLAERRLARLAGVASPHDLWSVCDRVNLVPFFPGHRPRLERFTRGGGYDKHQSAGHAFPLASARFFARELDLVRRYHRVVLLGLGVARALGVKRPVLLQVVALSPTCTALVFPHPSGVSHFWNDPARVDAARDALRAFLRDEVVVVSCGNSASDASPIVSDDVDLTAAMARVKKRRALKA